MEDYKEIVCIYDIHLMFGIFELLYKSSYTGCKCSDPGEGKLFNISKR